MGIEEQLNHLDTISKVSTEFGKNCNTKMMNHSKWALKWFALTLFGGLAVLYHTKAASYYSGAEEVYKRYSDIRNDTERFENEWKELNN